ncbi:acyl-[acyl-carrier-protein] thioesterase [Roseospira navarrensis]|nr:acyl-ACP thioesterase domain-containing protein [Roseospira navarrensis]
MTTTHPIWTAHYPVNTLVLDHRKRLGLVGLLQILQDVAWLHARHLGHGYEAMMDRGTLWVLARFQLAILGPRPTWGQDVTVRTWVRPPAGPIALRDYEILAEDGAPVAEATAGWLTLDAASRRPRKLALDGDGRFPYRRDGTLTLQPGKLPPRTDLPEVARVAVHNSDLDVNGHVNNTHYARWILDTLPLAEIEAHRLVRYEINFLAESALGDTVIVERGPMDAVTGAGAVDAVDVQVQGRRASDGAVLFVARLGAERR